MRRRDPLSLKFRPETKLFRGFVVTEPAPLAVVTQPLAIVSVPPTILRYSGRFGSLKTKRCQNSGSTTLKNRGQQLLKLAKGRKNHPWVSDFLRSWVPFLAAGTGTRYLTDNTGENAFPC
jgi:hypothetical protein